MESKDDLTGKLARLPDGQLVKFEVVHSNGYASLRRIGGPYADSIAVCLISKLESKSETLQERRGSPL